MSTVTGGGRKNVPFPSGSTLADVRSVLGPGGSLCVINAPDESGTLVLDSQPLVDGRAYEFKVAAPLAQQERKRKLEDSDKFYHSHSRQKVSYIQRLNEYALQMKLNGDSVQLFYLDLFILKKILTKLSNVFA